MPTGLVNEISVGHCMTAAQPGINAMKVENDDVMMSQGLTYDIFPADNDKKLHQVFVYTTGDNVVTDLSQHQISAGIMTRSRRQQSTTQQEQTIVTVNNKIWSGGATVFTDQQQPIAGDLKNEDDSIPAVQPDFALIQDKTDPDFEPNDSGRSTASPMSGTRTSGRGGRRFFKRDEEELSPEEEERRRIRRERNKQAAARCRKRRVDQTNSLQGQVDEWELKKKQLQDEILKLKSQHEELNFILEAHRTVCQNASKVKKAKSDFSPIENILGEISTVNMNSVSMPEVVVPQYVSTSSAAQLNIPKVVVKSEPISTAPPTSMALMEDVKVNLPSQMDVNDNNMYETADVIVSTSRQLTHQEALEAPMMTTINVDNTQEQMYVPASFTTLPMVVTEKPGAIFTTTLPTSQSQSQHRNVSSNKPARPLSLALKSNMMRSIEGIPIETPTNVVTNLNFDALMDGRTGLTPTNILTPVNMSFNLITSNNSSSSSVLNTPTVVTPSCGSQQRNGSQQSATVGGNSSILPGVLTPGMVNSMFLTEMVSPDNGGPKLVSL